MRYLTAVALILWTILAHAQVTPSVPTQTISCNPYSTTHSPANCAGYLPFPENAAVVDPTPLIFSNSGYVLYAHPTLGNVPWGGACAAQSVYTLNVSSGTNTYPVSGRTVSPCTGSTYSTTAPYPVLEPGAFEPDLDITVNCGGAALTNGMHFFGGHNWYVVGCQFKGTTPETSGCAAFYGASGTVYIEGIQCDDSLTTAYQDFIDISGTSDNPAIGSGAGITGTYSVCSTYITGCYISLSAISAGGVTITRGMLVGAPNNGQNGMTIYTQVTGVNPPGCTAPCISVSKPITHAEINQPMQFFVTFNPTFIIQNANALSMKGCDQSVVPSCGGTLHSDGIQIQGPINVVCVFNFTEYTNYNGINIDAQAPYSKAVITNANINFQTNTIGDAFTAGIFHDVVSGIPAASEAFPPIQLSSVYMDVNQTFGVVNLVPGYNGTGCPGAGGCGIQYSAYANSGSTNPTPAGAYIVWSSALNITGGVVAGRPPGGDFSTTTGLSYTALPSLGKTCQ